MITVTPEFLETVAACLKDAGFENVSSVRAEECGDGIKFTVIGLRETEIVFSAQQMEDCDKDAAVTEERIGTTTIRTAKGGKMLEEITRRFLLANPSCA